MLPSSSSALRTLACLAAGSVALAQTADQPRFAASFGPGLGPELVTRSIALGDLDLDGRLDLLLQRPGGGLLLGIGKGAYLDVSELLPPQFGEAGGAVALGDIDNDGDLDLVATHASNNEVFLNDSLSFAAVGSVPSLLPLNPPGSPPFLGLTLFDSDQDGFQDLLQASGDIVRLHRGDGTGLFTGLANDLPFTLVGPILELTVADTNADGWLDVMASDALQTEVVLGGASGMFAPFLQLDLAAPVVLLDHDADGDLDLIGREPSSDAIQVFERDVSGPVGLTPLGTSAAPRSIVVSDLDHDLDLDLGVLVAGGALERFDNDGLGGYVYSSSEVVVGGLPPADQLWSLDLDADGDLDMLASADPFGSSTAGSIALQPAGEGLVLLAASAVRAPLTDPKGLGDYDSDGRLDIVRPLGNAEAAADPTAISSWMDVGFGRYAPSVSAPIVAPFDDVRAYSAGDLTGDGNLDLLVAGFDDDGLGGLVPARPMALIGDGAGGAPVNPNFTPFAERAATDVELFDANGDGRLDMYIACRDSSDPTQLDAAARNQNGAVLLSSPFALAGATGSSVAIEALDADLDGDLDIMCGRRADAGAAFLSDQDALLINSGIGVFTDASATRLPVLGVPTRDVLIGDVDKDGDVDVLLTTDEGGSVSAPVPNGDVLLLNDGAGVFSDGSGLLPAESFGDGPAVWADLDFDNDLDLIEVAGDGSRAAIFVAGAYGKELPLISELETLPSGRIAAADIDTDGDVDLLHDAGLWRGLRRELSVRSTSSIGDDVVVEVTTLGPSTVYVLGYALGTAFLDLPPLGTLGLDLSTQFVIVGSGPVNAANPQRIRVGVPNQPSIVGIEVWWQALLDFPLRLTRAVSGTLDDL